MRSIPVWFAAVGAIIYTTGFVTVLEYQDSYGITGYFPGFLQTQFAYVGMLAFVIPLIVGGNTYAFYWIWTTDKIELARKTTFSWAICSIFLALVVFVSFVLFAPKGAFAENAHFIPLFATIFVLPVVSDLSDVDSLLIRFWRSFWNAVRTWNSSGWILMRLALQLSAGADNRHIAQQTRTDRKSRARSVCFVLIVTLFWSLYPWVWERNFLSKWFFLALAAVVCPSIAAGVLVRRAQRSKSRSSIKWPMLGSVLFFLYSLTVVAFGYGLFHWIPASKGGGDLSDVGYVKLWVDRHAPSKIRELEQMHLSLIVATDESLFVADACPLPSGKDRRKVWRQARKFRPERVYEVPRSFITRVDHENPR